MAITLEAIRAAGGIVHCDGNIFFRDISMLQGLAGAAPAAGAPQGERQWICPTRTVADLVNNLLTMDQALPIYGAQYIEKDGRRCAIAVPPTVSRERVKDGRWIGQGEELNAAVIWTRAEQPAAMEGSAARKVFLVATGETSDGAETYTRHDDAPPPLCDAECLYTAPAAPALEAPAAPADEHAAFQADYLRWCPGKQGRLGRDGAGERSGYSHAMVQARWLGWSARAALAAAPQAPAAHVDDLAALVKKLVQALRKAAPNHVLPAQALDYLKRQGLQGSPLRAAEASPQAPAAPVTWPMQEEPDGTVHAVDPADMAAPAAPAVDARDTARMDWLEAQVVNVRAPLRYGSRDMFWASPEEVDGGPDGPSDLRARIDAAQAAAKGA